MRSSFNNENIKYKKKAKYRKETIEQSHMNWEKQISQVTNFIISNRKTSRKEVDTKVN